MNDREPPTPPKDWEPKGAFKLLYCIFVAPIALLGLLVVGPFVLFLIAAILGATLAIDRLKFRRALRRQGRLIARKDLEQKLRTGEGTFIEEMTFKGPHRAWWTEDDIPSRGELPSSDREVYAIACDGAEHEFNARCLEEYIDTDRGRARLVPLSMRAIRKGEIARRYPRSRWVRIARPVHFPDDEPSPPEGPAS